MRCTVAWAVEDQLIRWRQCRILYTALLVAEEQCMECVLSEKGSHLRCRCDSRESE